MSFDSELHEMIQCELRKLPRPAKNRAGMAWACLSLIAAMVMMTALFDHTSSRIFRLESQCATDREFSHGTTLGPVVQIMPRAHPEPLPSPLFENAGGSP